MSLTPVFGSPNMSDNEIDKSLENIPIPPVHVSLSKRVNVGSDETIGQRPTMEDASVVGDIDLNGEQCTVVGLFDGHAGPEVAGMCKENLLQVIGELNSTTNSTPNLPQVLTRTFQKLHGNVTSLYGGSTALVVVLFPNGSGGYGVIVANAGDSRAIIVPSDTTQPPTQPTNDHKGTYGPEQERVKAAKGRIINFRVGGILAVTRAIGDRSLTLDGVICEPEISSLVVASGDLIVVACDGLWDVLSNAEVAEIVRNFVMNNAENNENKLNTTHLAQILRDKAYSGGSTDNISVIVVCVE